MLLYLHYLKMKLSLRFWDKIIVDYLGFHKSGSDKRNGRGKCAESGVRRQCDWQAETSIMPGRTPTAKAEKHQEGIFTASLENGKDTYIQCRTSRTVREHISVFSSHLSVATLNHSHRKGEHEVTQSFSIQMESSSF